MGDEPAADLVLDESTFAVEPGLIQARMVCSWRAPSGAASGVARSDVWCTLRLKAALRSLAPLTLRDQMLGDFAGTSMRVRAGHDLPWADSMRALWSARLHDRLLDLRIGEISLRFGASKDRVYRSRELEPAAKADLYAEVQTLAELEETAGLLGVQHARISDVLQSAEYGPIDPPGISNPSGYGLRSAGRQAPEAGGAGSVQGVHWQRFSKAALDGMPVLPLKTFFDIRQPSADRSLLEPVAVPAYVHPDCVWHPPHRSPIRAQIRALWGPPEAALRVLVSPQPSPGALAGTLGPRLRHEIGQPHGNARHDPIEPGRLVNQDTGHQLAQRGGPFRPRGRRGEMRQS